MRNKWTSSYSVNYEPHKKAPLDARQYTEKKSDLTLQSTWTGNDWNVWAYDWMIVAVTNDWTNSWIYMLNSGWNDDYTDINNWLFVLWTSNDEILSATKFVFVDPANGNDSTGDWTEASPRKTIRRACDHKIDTNWYIYNVMIESDIVISDDDIPYLRNVNWLMQFIGTWANELESDLTFTYNSTFEYTCSDSFATDQYKWKFVSFYKSSNKQWIVLPVASNDWTSFQLPFFSSNVGSYTKIIEFTVWLDIQLTRANIPWLDVKFINFNITHNVPTWKLWLGNPIQYARSDVDINWAEMEAKKRRERTELLWFASCYIRWMWDGFIKQSWSRFYKNVLRWNWDTVIALWWIWYMSSCIVDDVKYAFEWNKWVPIDVTSLNQVWMRDSEAYIGMWFHTQVNMQNRVWDYECLRLTNTNYVIDIKEQDWDWIMSSNFTTSTWINGTPNIWYINYNWYKLFKYLDLERWVHLNIPWTYPEQSWHETETLANNTTNWKIVVWSLSENRTIELQYNISRDMWGTIEYREWKIKLLNSWTSVIMNEESQETNSVWVTFNNPTINWDDIEIDYTTDNSWNNWTINYIATRQMIF